MRLSGTGCLAAFGLPFLAAGIGGLWIAARGLGGPDPARELLLPAAAGVLFTLVGAGIVAAAAYGHRAAGIAAALRERHPEAPWRWRADWDAGQVRDASRATLVAAWSFSLFWNLIAWTSMAAALGDVRGWRVAAVAVFPLVGLGLLAWAVRATIRFARFGTSVLELDTVPGTIGRGLAGTVRIPAAVQHAMEYQVTLRRVERTVSGSGRNRSTRESTRWEEQSLVPASRDAIGISVPVAFRIPAAEVPTSSETANPTTIWRLEIAAEVPGVNYAAQFEVPVFPASAAPGDGANGDIGFDAPVVVPPEDYRQPRESRIRVSEAPRGLEIYYPAARNPGAATGLTAFLALWGGAVALLLHLDAPLVFPIFFGAIAVLLLAGVLHLWFGTTRVTVTGRDATVRSGLLGLGKPRRLGRQDIDRAEVRIGMQAGTRTYYDVRLVMTNGRTVVAGSAIGSKREAEWLAHRIERGLGISG